MTLDDAEKLARDCLHRGGCSEFSELEIAAVLLAVLPVVRAAGELHDYDFCDATMGGGLVARDPVLYGKVAAVYDAIDKMRAAPGKP